MPWREVYIANQFIKIPGPISLETSPGSYWENGMANELGSVMGRVRAASVVLDEAQRISAGPTRRTVLTGAASLALMSLTSRTALAAIHADSGRQVGLDFHPPPMPPR